MCIKIIVKKREKLWFFLAKAERFAILSVRNRREVIGVKRIGLILLAVLCLILSACRNPELEAKEAAYIQAQALLEEKAYDQAKAAFTALGTYRDSHDLLSEIEMAKKYDAALELLENKDYFNAYTALDALGEYQDAPKLLERFQIVEITAENWDNYFEIVEELELDPFLLSEEGYYQRIPIYYSVVLKEGIRECFYLPDRNTMTAKIQTFEEAKDFYLDRQTGEYFFSDSENWVFQNKKTLVAELHGDKSKETFETDMIYSETDGQGHHLYYSGSPWTDLTVKEAEGRLYLYTEE